MYRNHCKFIWLRHVVLQNNLLQQQLFTPTPRAFTRLYSTSLHHFSLRCWNPPKTSPNTGPAAQAATHSDFGVTAEAHAILRLHKSCPNTSPGTQSDLAVTKRLHGKEIKNWPGKKTPKLKNSTLISRQATFHSGEVQLSSLEAPFRVQVGRGISRWATRPLCRRHMPLGLESQWLPLGARLTSGLPFEMLIDSGIKIWFNWHTGMFLTVFVLEESWPKHLSEFLFSSKFLGHDQNRSLESCCSWWAQTFLISSLSSATALGFLVKLYSSLIAALHQGTGRLNTFFHVCYTLALLKVKLLNQRGDFEQWWAMQL